MLTALVLVCLLASTPHLRDCTPENAADTLAVPGEYGNPLTCLSRAQAFVAATYPLDVLATKHRLKVVCRPPAAASQRWVIRAWRRS